MYVVVASQVDDAARELAPLLAEEPVPVLTPADLSRPGWRVPSGNGQDATFVAGGERYATRRLRGVLNLLPGVFPPELVQITPENREYAAAEMTAFLRYWLQTLPCPVLNPPTAGCLAGPNWRREMWFRAAADAGLAVRPLVRSTVAASAAQERATPRRETVTLIAGEPLTDARSDLVAATGALADRAGVGVLSVTFVEDAQLGFAFEAASTFPRLGGPRAAQLISAHFRAKTEVR
jgi:hypothetical protein